MKTKVSNIIFFSYLAIILILLLGILIYLRTVVTSGDFIKQNKMNIDVNIGLNNENLKPVQEFNVVYLTNVDEANLVQKDSFLVDIPDTSMQVRNDTLFVHNCENAQIIFKHVNTIIVKQNSTLNLVSDSDNSLKIISQDAEINMAAVNINTLLLISTGNSNISLAAAKINTLKLNMQGKNELNLMSRIKLLEGNNSEQTSITMFPKPKKVRLRGNTIIK